MPRSPTHCYVDPLDAVWLAAAQSIGFRVVRSAQVYAASDGGGTLSIGTAETLDADDCLAQMLLHELCHGLVQGESALAQPDWGLDNETQRDAYRERAALRVQAALTARFGLQRVLAPTTEFRDFYLDVCGDPLGAAQVPQERTLARRGLERAERPPWAPHLERALRATAAIATAAAQAGAAQLHGPLPVLWCLIDEGS